MALSLCCNHLVLWTFRQSPRFKNGQFCDDTLWTALYLYRIRLDRGIYEPGFWTLILLLLITSFTLIIITLLSPYRAPYSPLLLHLRSRTRLGRSVVLTWGRSRNYVFYEKKEFWLYNFETPWQNSKSSICKNVVVSYHTLNLKYILVNLRNYLVNKVAVQMGQMGLVAVGLVAGTCQEVVGAKKKYLCTMRSKAGEV